MEAVLAAAVFGVLAAGLLVMVVAPIQSTGGAADRERAIFLSEEGIEAVRSIRNDSWLGLTVGTHGLAKGTKWAFSGASDTTSDGPLNYVRTVTIEPVNRDGGDIVASGGASDPRTRKVTSTITWTSRLGLPQSLTTSAYLMHDNAYDWKQTTDAHFGGGTHAGTEVFGSGDSASVQLAPSDEDKFWTLASGSLVTRTTDTDFAGGAFSGTAVSGTGIDASIVGTGSPKWLQIQAGGNILETDNGDFEDGAFSSTAVADTGDLAGVQLTSAQNWAAMSPPTGENPRDVFMVSSTDGWGVADNGVIVRWDGTAWSQFTDLGTHDFRGVSCSSSADCWAVADSGRIARWDGTAWSQFTDLGGQTFDDIYMVSATEGYAVADNGEAYRWNGTAWALDVSTGTTEDLLGVSGASSSGSTGSVTETTDTDFGDGTFSDTEVSGTGAAGSVTLAQGLNWAAMSSPTGNQFNDVSMLSATDGWAVGNTGTVARWNGTAWSSVSFPDTDNVMGVSAISANDAWASGGSGRVWHWNGTAWTRYADYGSQTWNDIDCPSSTSCYMVGSSANNLIWRWTGSGAFAAMTDPGGNQRWYGISCPSTTLCWASGNSGEIGRMSGTTWTEIQDTGSALYSIHMVDANTGYAVGNSGNVRRCTAGGCDTNGEWLTADLGSQVFRAVSAVSSSLAFAVGDGGIIYRWNGSSWADETSPTGNALRGVSAVSSSLVFAAGASGTILRYGNSYLASGAYTSSVLDSGTAGVTWSTASWTETAPGGTDVTVATRTGPTPTPDGSWSSWSGELTSPGGSSVTSPPNRYVQYRATLTTGNGAVTPTLDSVTLSYDTSIQVIFAVTDGGAIIRRFPSGWTQVFDVGWSALNDVSCRTSSDCWAVGDEGIFVRWDGSSWSQVADVGWQQITAVSAASATDAWAVSSSWGWELWHWNGSSWSSVTAPANFSMYGLAMVSSSDGYAVGASGAVWQFGTHFVASGTYVSSALDGGAVVTWGHAFWSERLPDNTDLTVAFRTGDTAVPDGSWSAWTSEYSDPTNTTIPSGIAARRYIQYRVTFSTTDQFETPRLDAINLTFNEPAAVSFFDVKVTSAADGWSVGQGGTMARFNGTEWISYSPSPTSETLLDVDFFDEDHVWAVGNDGAIVFWNGSSWTVQTSGTTRTLRGVAAVSATEAWAVGDRGTILRWNGTSWSSVSSGTTQTLNAVDMLSASSGWVVGNRGTILRWNGTSWSSVTSGTTSPLNGISAVSSSVAVVVGQGGVALHWDGASWTTVPSSTDNALNDVWCVSSSSCWAFGVQATFVNWDGSAWSQYVFSNPSNPVVQGGHMTTLTEGWAVGEGGAFYHYTPQFTSPSTYTSTAIDGGAADIVWNTVFWDSVEPIFTGITVATRTGPTSVPDGSWSPWSSEYTDKGGSNVTSPTGQYLQFRVTFTTSQLYSLGVFQEFRAIHSAVTGQDLYDTDGTAPGDVWAVGRSGTIAHYTGLSWSLVSSPTANSLRGVDAVSEDDAYAVGDSGTLLLWDGTSWASLTSPTTNDLLSVGMASSSVGFAVGSSGTIIRWNGTSWVAESSPTGNTLRGVDMLDATLGFAVGAGGTIIRWNGTAWSSVSSPTGTQLNAVHVFSPTYALAVGNNGVILQWDGTAWSSAPSPTAVSLNAVEARSASEAWAAGNFGLILKWDGTAWESFTSPTGMNLYGITVEAPTDGWICGQLGTLLKDPAPYVPYGTFHSSVLDTDAGPAGWDAFWFNMALPAGTSVTVAFRAGDTATPDGTWSAFTGEQTTTSGVDLGALPAARYLQYRATLTTSDVMQTPAFEDITVTYRK